MRIIIASIIISLFLGALGYISSGNIIVASSIFLVYLLYGSFYVKRKIEDHRKMMKSAHECQQFINNFLLSMSVRSSFADAFSNAVINADGHLKDELAHIEHLSVRERIDCLNKYFHFDVYYMFLNILTLYEDQGGDILTMAETLIQEVNRMEEAMMSVTSLINRKVVEFVILWTITLGIIIFMRFGVGQFYSKLLNAALVIVMTLSLFALLFVSVHLAIKKFTNSPIIEGNHHETI
ncbi:MAG: hypothetical protein WCX85_04710 [Bacilli bacterium]|jgi:hypothetical protein|nr:hypothetical protein [Bacilli bacterium]